MLKVTGARKRGRSLLCRAPGAPSPGDSAALGSTARISRAQPLLFWLGIFTAAGVLPAPKQPQFVCGGTSRSKTFRAPEGGLMGVWLQASFGVFRGHLNPLIRGIWANAAPESSPRSARGALPGRERRAMASSCRKSRVRAGRGRAAGGRLAGDGARGVDGRDPRGGGGCCPPAEPRSPLPEPLSVPPCAPPRL